MLRDSPVHIPQRQQLSAKATGEPPLMMAAAVACALQDAVHAAWRQYSQQQRGQAVVGAAGWPVLELPATTANILKALPPQPY
jgi:xanthine dehydrogenase molybdopterin-binding subunit B